MMGLGPHLGRQRAHDLVYDICRQVTATGLPSGRSAGEGSEIGRHMNRAELENCAIPHAMSDWRARWSTGCWRGRRQGALMKRHAVFSSPFRVPAPFGRKPIDLAGARNFILEFLPERREGAGRW